MPNIPDSVERDESSSPKYFAANISRSTNIGPDLRILIICWKLTQDKQGGHILTRTLFIISSGSLAVAYSVPFRNVTYRQDNTTNLTRFFY